MAIGLPEGLPAAKGLRAEGIAVTECNGAHLEPRRPLRILLINLMPLKQVTELQIARLLGSAPSPVELTLCVPDSYRPKTANPGHLAAFYRTWSQVRGGRFDGLIVTGAPVETLSFEEVTYWPELKEIMDWAKSRVSGSLYICWAAQAALWHFHGVPKHRLTEKRFGVFSHCVLDTANPLMSGFGREFVTPVSRHTEVRVVDLPLQRGLKVLAKSPETGLCLIEDTANSAVYMFNHLEYDADTLKQEYLRDLSCDTGVSLPKNYFPNDDAGKPPVNRWAPFAHLLFRNWIEGLERKRPEQETSGQMLQWLLSSHRPLSVAGTEFTDFLVSAGDEIDVLPGILRHLADEKLSPKAVKTHRRPNAQILIELRIEGIEEAGAQRIAQRLLRQGRIAKVSYRTSLGSGGLVAGREILSRSVTLRRHQPALRSA